MRKRSPRSLRPKKWNRFCEVDLIEVERGTMSDWSNGLCSCFNDCTICLLSWFIPCYQFGKNAEAVGDSCCLCGFLMCFLWWWGGPYNNIWTSFLRCTIRGKIRQQKGIDGSALGDCCCNFWCAFCTLAQESQELQGVGGQSMARE